MNPPPVKPRCTCGHLYTVHVIKTFGPPEIRAACNAGTAAGPCPCRHYTPEEDTDHAHDRHPPDTAHPATVPARP